MIPAAEDAVDILDQEENLAHFDPAELDSGSDVGSDIDEPNDATSATYDALISNLLQMVDFLETERKFPGDKCVKKLTEAMGVPIENFFDDVRKRKNARTFNATWTNRKHPIQQASISIALRNENIGVVKNAILLHRYIRYKLKFYDWKSKIIATKSPHEFACLGNMVNSSVDLPMFHWSIGRSDDNQLKSSMH